MTSTSPTRRSMQEDFGAGAPEDVSVRADPEDGDEVSLFALANVLLRWRWTIIALAFTGGVLGLAKGFSGDRLYKSTAIFIPQTGGGGSSPSGLALAASQFGINIPSAGGGWGPPMYVELIKSRALLAPLAFDTVVVAEENDRRAPMMELLKANTQPTPERQMNKAAAGLAGMVSATEEKKLSAVKINVVTKWPSVSLALANRLLERVNEFNLQTRKSQALAERRFVEAQTQEAERALRDAEDRLLDFYKRNRAIEGSPELVVMRDRLQREVTHRQMSYTSWVGNREEARIREIRDTPVITVLEEPRLPLVVEPRRSLRKGILGGLVGVILGCIIAFAAEGMARAQRARGRDAREFFSLLRAATPRFLWRA